jgi:hypothetical protein
MVGYYTLMNSTMKKIKNILVMVAVLVTTLACDREFDSDDIAVGVIRFPAIQVLGDPVVIVNQGGTYSDVGASASLGTDDISSQIETSSNLNLNVPGVYSVNYSVTNVNELNQESTVTELRVVVVAPSNPNNSRDLSGIYHRVQPTGTGIATWTKVAPGLYVNDNLGGVIAPSQAIIPVYVFDLADGTTTIPLQPVTNGYVPTVANITITPAGYNLSIPATPGFGTQNRVFVKQ